MTAAPDLSVARRLRLAIATCGKHPSLYAEEAGLPAALERFGIEAKPVLWDDPRTDWRSFDAVLVRSTWDYVEKAAAFTAWIDGIERAGVPLLNRASLLRWNLDKHYLSELALRGIPIVPTVFIDEPQSLDAALSTRGWDRAVLKPALSAGSRSTVRFRTEQAAEHQVLADELARGPGALLQPYLPEIETSGELSFLFFAASPSADPISFAAAKIPKPGDFRVQFTYGGTFKRVEPLPPHREAALAVLAALPSRPAYARVDGVVLGGVFHLMEVELVEPYLYLAAAPELFDAVAGALAEAVASAVTAGRQP